MTRSLKRVKKSASKKMASKKSASKKSHHIKSYKLEQLLKMLKRDHDKKTTHKKRHPKRKTSHKKKKHRHTKRKRKQHRMKGGALMGIGGSACPIEAGTTHLAPSGVGLVPKELVNMGRSVEHGVGSAYAAINGTEGPVDPLPFKDQLNDGRLPEDLLLRV